MREPDRRLVRRRAFERERVAGRDILALSGRTPPTAVPVPAHTATPARAVERAEQSEAARGIVRGLRERSERRLVRACSDGGRASQRAQRSEKHKRLGRCEAVCGAVLCGTARCGTVRGGRGPWWTERARAGRGERVVASATSIRAGSAESADMSLSDRERPEGFQPTLYAAVEPTASERAGGFHRSPTVLFIACPDGWSRPATPTMQRNPWIRP